MKTRKRSSAAHDASAVARPPVVVTIDSSGGVVDMVGELGMFAGDGSNESDVAQCLLDLLQGTGGHAEVLHSVELAPRRYADIHIVAEGDLRHFVLLDATEVMQALQRSQQMGHDAALGQERERRALRHPANDRIARQGGAFRFGAGLFAAIATEMRESLVLLSGHARMLARHCEGDEIALRSVAAIQHAALCLDALSSNGLIALGGLAGDGRESGVVNLQQLAAFLHDAFALQAKGQGVGFEVQVPRSRTLVELDDFSFRQVLMNLLIHALDGMSHGELMLSLSPGARHMEVEISAEPDGFKASHFGPLITTPEVLRSNAMGSLELAVSQQILRRMDARIELVPAAQGGYLVWFRIPVRQASNGGTPDPKAVAVAVAEANRESLDSVLLELGATVVVAPTIAEAERLIRDGVANACVMSREILERDGAAPFTELERVPTMIIGAEEASAGEAGWISDGVRISVATGYDRKALYDAVTAMLSNLPGKSG